MSRIIYRIKKVSLPKALLLIGVGALALAAIAFVIANLYSNYGNLIFGQVALTALTLVNHSLAAFVCVVLYRRRHQLGRLLALAGIIVTLISLVYSVWFAWQFVTGNETDLQSGLLYILFVLTVSFAQACLVLLSSPKTKEVRMLLAATLSLIVVVALLSITWIFAVGILGNQVPDVFENVVFGLILLDIAGTMLTPLLNRYRTTVGAMLETNLVRALALLSVGSLLAATVLTGIFGAYQAEDGYIKGGLIWTALALGGHSLAAVCFVTLYKSGRRWQQLLALLGVCVLTISLSVMLLYIWDFAEGEFVENLSITLGYATLILGFACYLLLVVSPKVRAVPRVFMAALSLAVACGWLAMVFILSCPGCGEPAIISDIDGAMCVSDTVRASAKSLL